MLCFARLHTLGGHSLNFGKNLDFTDDDKNPYTTTTFLFNWFLKNNLDQL